MSVHQRRQLLAAAVRHIGVAVGALACALIVIGAVPRTVGAQALFADSIGVRRLKEAVKLQSPDVAARRAALEAARARLHATGFAPAASD